MTEIQLLAVAAVMLWAAAFVVLVTADTDELGATARRLLDEEGRQCR